MVMEALLRVPGMPRPRAPDARHQGAPGADGGRRGAHHRQARHDAGGGFHQLLVMRPAQACSASTRTRLSLRHRERRSPRSRARLSPAWRPSMRRSSACTVPRPIRTMSACFSRARCREDRTMQRTLEQGAELRARVVDAARRRQRQASATAAEVTWGPASGLDFAADGVEQAADEHAIDLVGAAESVAASRIEATSCARPGRPPRNEPITGTGSPSLDVAADEAGRRRRDTRQQASRCVQRRTGSQSPPEPRRGAGDAGRARRIR